MCAAIDLNRREILFLLGCIETADSHRCSSPDNKALYQRLVQEYLGIVRASGAPHKPPHQAA